MRDAKGRFVRGVRSSPATEFKPGQHWRPHQEFRERDFLVREYCQKGRSAADIAADYGVGPTAIVFWLDKHDIPRRTVSEARKLKRWGESGPKNPNYVDGSSKDRLRHQNGPRMQSVIRFVREREGNRCERCKRDVSGKNAGATHHRKRWAGCSEHRYDPDAISLLCVTCHAFVHSGANVDREFLED